ncbi:uncharacterized protein LOC112538540 [Tetranychus urticae]|uniref:uncharacterized protein LOC112538540 n=1 Tax=Tetranychus urticae TaxID=32264 RepID=UPI000D651D37|nr:uncharacterized protein LOC112538540 [Tetranychus urticae]
MEDHDNGVSCSVFMTPLKNLFRYSQEIPLKNLHERLNHISISFISPENNKMFTFTPYHVADATKVNDNEHDSLFDSVFRNIKFVEEKMKTISVTGATDSSFCYRKCANSDENNCNSFSFCVYDDTVECLVSTNENISPQTTSSDASCITYLMDNLAKFKKIPSKRFTDNQNTVSFDSSLGKCNSKQEKLNNNQIGKEDKEVTTEEKGTQIESDAASLMSCESCPTCCKSLKTTDDKGLQHLETFQPYQMHLGRPILIPGVIEDKRTPNLPIPVKIPVVPNLSSHNIASNKHNKHVNKNTREEKENIYSIIGPTTTMYTTKANLHQC